MSYESPIKMTLSETMIKLEDMTINAVRNIGINVDKHELIRALQYDRNQYEKGRADVLRELFWKIMNDAEIEKNDKDWDMVQLQEVLEFIEHLGGGDEE